MRITPAALACIAALAASAALAQTPPPALPTADQTDPARLGWMVGSPPPADKLIRFADGSFYTFPRFRWSFSNTRQFGPTTNVSRGIGAVATLPRAERADLDTVSFTPLGKTEPIT